MRLFPKNKFLMIFPLILKCSVFQYLLVLGKQIALYLAFKNPTILLTGVGILASLNLNYFLFPADETHLKGQTGPPSCCGDGQAPSAQSPHRTVAQRNVVISSELGVLRKHSFDHLHTHPLYLIF